MINVGIKIVPKTSLGRWSVGLAAIVIIVIVLNILLGPMTRRVLEFNPGSIELRIFFIAHCIAGIGSLVTGLISIIKNRERSILTFLALVIGFYTLLFICFFVGEAQW
jgi:hypothetical protein